MFGSKWPNVPQLFSPFIGWVFIRIGFLFLSSFLNFLFYFVLSFDLKQFWIFGQFTHLAH